MYAHIGGQFSGVMVLKDVDQLMEDTKSLSTTFPAAPRNHISDGKDQAALELPYSWLEYRQQHQERAFRRTNLPAAFLSRMMG